MVDINKLTTLSSSTVKKDRIAAQRMLKGLGLYKGPLDGNLGKGSSAAIAKIRSQIAEEKSREGKLARLKIQAAEDARKDKAARQKREDEAAALALKNKNAQAKKDREAKDAGVQVGFTVLSLGTSVGFANHEVNKMNAIDAKAVKVRNIELKRYVGEIDKIKSEPGARNRNKTPKAETKRRIAAIASKAQAQGVTRYKAPIGLSSGVLLAGKGLLLQYAASKTSNEYARDGLNAAASGLYIAGLGVPAARFTRAKFGKNPLHGGHLGKLADAEALGKTVAKKAAPKAVASNSTYKLISNTLSKVANSKVSKVALRVAGPAALVFTAATVGYSAYTAYKKTGSLASAAEAGADTLTLGGYGLAKKYATLSTSKTIKESKVSAVKTPKKAVKVASVGSRKRYIQVTNAKGTTFKRLNPNYGKRAA